MKRASVLFAVFISLVPESWASPKSDSIVALVGDHAKFVWRRVAVCNESYQSITPINRLMLLDTREGTERVLHEGGTYRYIRISRSGRWVTWNTTSKALFRSDTDLDRTMILDLTASSPQSKVLFDKANCAYWCVRAMWVDPATKTEWVYCLNNYGPIGGGLIHGDGIYKVPLTATGTADVSKAVKLTINGSPKVDDVLSVSADGKKLGSAFPWPDTYILDVATGRLDLRHEPGFGCQANLAPDNSYRFFHCEGDHFGIYLFEANMVNQHWFVDLSKNLDGFPAGTGMDFAAPRWTNHGRFITNTFPMNDNWDSYDESYYAGRDAAWVKANVDILHVPQFVLEKFTADFKGIERSKLIASDIRYLQYGGDGWLANGVTAGSTAAAPVTESGSRDAGIRVLRTETAVTIAAGTGVGAVLRITDAKGRLVRQQAIRGTACVETNGFDAGVYHLSLTGASGGSSTRQLIIAR